MINFLGRKLGNYYYTRYPDDLDLQTWIDGIRVILLYVMSIITLGAYSIITGEWIAILLNLGVLCILRSIDEGRHYNLDQCFIITNGLLLLSSTVSTYLLKNYILLSIMLLIVTLFLLVVKTFANKRKFVFVLYVSVLVFSYICLENIFITVVFIAIDYSTYHKK